MPTRRSRSTRRSFGAGRSSAVANTLRIYPAVVGDSRHATDWYDAIGIALGNRFRAELRDKFAAVRRHPTRFAILAGEDRFARLARFPFFILFRKRGNVVHVIGLFHSASDPNSWRERISST